MLYKTWTWILYTSLICLFLIPQTSCKKECDNNCNDHGICIDGTCDCLDGYLGEFCEKRETTKYIGDYDATRTCDGIEDNLPLSIRESQLEVRKIYFDFDGLTIFGIVHNNDIEIPEQQWLNIYEVHPTTGRKYGALIEFDFHFTFLGTPAYSQMCHLEVVQD